MITVVLQASNYKESIQNRNFQMIQKVPVISYVIRRLKSDDELKIILATSDRPEDDVFVEIANAEGIQVCRGSYDDVLERIWNAAKASDAENIVRVYANYPLLDIKRLKELYKEHISNNYDYSYNEHQRGVLWGMGCEVFRTSLLDELREKKLTIAQREAFSFYIRQNSDKYRVLRKEVCQNRPNYKVALETNKDLAVICELVEHLDEEINDEAVQKYFEKHSLLAAYNQEEPAKEVGLEKLFLHPEKIASLTGEQEIDMLYPISVEMTLTNQCNLKCVYCSDNDLRSRQGKTTAMSLETIKSLFADLAKGGTKGVVLEGGGEPTLYRDFAEVVSCARENGLHLGLITNGTVHLPEELLPEFEWIRVSLDASTAEEYLALKGVDCFERVMGNIAYYAQNCQTVGVGYVVTNKNISQIETLVMRLRETGASYIQLRPVVDSEELYPYDVDLTFLRFYQNSSFAVITDGMKENAKAGNDGLPCVAHSLTTIISGDGSVYLCGRLNIFSWIPPIGNINNESFHDIWNGEERIKQAKMVKDATFCERNCPQCRISKFNKLVERLGNMNTRHFI